MEEKDKIVFAKSFAKKDDKTRQEKLKEIENDENRFFDMREKVDDRFKIADKLYSAISEDEFDIDVDLSEFDSKAFSSFYYDLASFNIIANKDKSEEFYDENTIWDIVNGKFKLREYNLKEGMVEQKKLIEEKRMPKNYLNSLSFNYELKAIQDGHYYFNKVSNIGKPSTFESILVTDPPKFYFDGVEQKIVENNYDDDIDFHVPGTVGAATLIKRFRNLIAHSAHTYIDGMDGSIHFVNDKFEFVCTKMWLRGFSTFWSARNKNLDVETIKAKILAEYGENKKSINGQDAIKDILKLVSEEINYNVKTSSSMYKFVTNRLKYYTNYYGLKTEDGKEDFDKKIDIFVNVIANNPNHTTVNREYLNSKILYNIQQIIGTHQMKDDEHKGMALSRSFNLELAGVKFDELDELKDKLDKLCKRNNEIYDFVKDMSPAKRANYMKSFKFVHEFKKNQEEFKTLKALYNKKMDDVVVILAHEAKDMDLFNKESIRNMPIEVAVNLVGYMGYNRFISTGFYQDVLEDGVRLDRNQEKAIMNLDLSGFTMVIGSRKMPLDTFENRLVFLKRIRHTTSHGLISYQIPPNSTIKSSIADVQITYAEKDVNKVHVTGKIGDYYNLFKNDFFAPSSSAKMSPKTSSTTRVK